MSLLRSLTLRVEFPRHLIAEGARLFRQRAKWLIVLTLVATAMLLGATTLAAIGHETGSSRLLSGLVWAVLPAPFYLLLIVWLDRNEPEPLWAMAAIYFWGALVATFLALLINTYAHAISARWFGPAWNEIYVRSVSAPVVEEVAKAAALLLFVFFRREEFDGVVDGLVYASLVGLGFATTENVLYYARAAHTGDTFSVLLARGVFTPYAHPLFTAVTGIGVGRAANMRSRTKQVGVVAICLLLAICMHAFWNASAAQSSRAGWSPFTIYLTVMVPLFLLAVGLSTLALHNEREVLKRELLREVDAGQLSEAELNELCTFLGRQRAVFRALHEGGVARLVLQLEFNKAAGNLAFYRNRVTRIRASDERKAEREAFYLERFVYLRSRMRS